MIAERYSARFLPPFDARTNTSAEIRWQFPASQKPPAQANSRSSEC